jgi:carboxymethylenebutenolidase
MSEEPVPLPSAPSVSLSPNVILQPPLSRRGIGPGVILVLPDHVDLSSGTTKPLDPEPVTKWAEEGFAVVGVTATGSISIDQVLQQGLDALQALDQVDIKDRFAVIGASTIFLRLNMTCLFPLVYDASLIRTVSDAVSKHPRIAAFIGYGSFPAPTCALPILIHLTANAPRPAHPPTDITTQHTYDTTSTAFVLPQAAKYDPGSASLAHSCTLDFLRKHLGGPFFDLGAIWDEHTYYEFQARSVAQTMGTMVVSSLLPSLWNLIISF